MFLISLDFSSRDKRYSFYESSTADTEIVTDVNTNKDHSQRKKTAAVKGQKR